MQTAAVIIPTIATKRTKQPVSRSEEVRLWSKMIRQVIINSAKSISNTGFRPAIVVVNNFQSEKPGVKEAIQKVIKTELGRLPPEIFEHVHIIERPGAGWMESILQGGQYAVDSLKADAVVSMADDFETEAPKIGRLLEPLRRKDQQKRADFVFARGEEYLHTFPPAQFFMERISSHLVNFANPRFKARKGEGFLAAATRSGREQLDIQSQSGLIAMNARTFTEGHDFISRHFSNADFGHSGLAPALILSVLSNPRRKMEGALFPRRFEHFFPQSQKEQQKLSASRTKFFEGAFHATKRFLEATGQHEKIGMLPQAQEAIDTLVSKAPRRWKPGIRKSEKVVRRQERKMPLNRR